MLFLCDFMIYLCVAISLQIGLPMEKNFFSVILKKVLTYVESDAIIDKLSRATGKQISRSAKIN